MDISKRKGILLDIGCGEWKQEGFVGMDARKVKGVDIVHNLEVIPYPIDDEQCLTIKGSHIWEHIKPWLTIDVMNELWRILRVGGQLMLSMPYGWSYGFIQDPTHCNPSNEATFQYFNKDSALYGIYRPKPWNLQHCAWQENGNLEVVMQKLKDERGPK
ncbi:MAG: hypothetical protein BBJ57_07485 [Desulfobacterales bacterium PC51MH44]|nr:MAG: hypothetical protein BBJ57_07485 [Desulfobacterales bacterium PC51MH44]